MKKDNAFPRTLSSVTKLQTKGLSFAARSAARAYAQVVDRLVRASSRFQKADIVIEEKKKGALYEAGVFIKQLGKKGFGFHVEGRSLRELLPHITRKIKRIVRKK